MLLATLHLFFTLFVNFIRHLNVITNFMVITLLFNKFTKFVVNVRQESQMPLIKLYEEQIIVLQFFLHVECDASHTLQGC